MCTQPRSNCSSMCALAWKLILSQKRTNISRRFYKDMIGIFSSALCMRSTANASRLIKNGAGSKVSHPVRMRVSNPHLPPTFDGELERLAAEAALHDVALEINGFDVLTYPSLVRRLAKACALQRTPISVGSDAHAPESVAQAHQQTEVILHEAGITSVRTWKQHIAEEYNI